MSLIHCIYTSTRILRHDDAEWLELADFARTSNASVDITSLMLSYDIYLLQLIEGLADDVDELFLHIAGDPRHSAVTEIIRETIPQRRFTDCPFACKNIASVELKVIEKTLLPPTCWHSLEPDQAIAWFDAAANW